MRDPLFRLGDLYDLARAWCPRQAWSPGFVAPKGPEWGPAHEIAHALLSLPAERERSQYGLCDINQCRCPGERCNVVEVAAVAISAKLHVAVGRRDLIDLEDKASGGSDWDAISGPWHQRRARQLLRRRGLSRIPRTEAGLKRLLRKRLGAP